jgi:hypothetical protein
VGAAPLRDLLQRSNSDAPTRGDGEIFRVILGNIVKNFLASAAQTAKQKKGPPQGAARV